MRILDWFMDHVLRVVSDAIDAAFDDDEDGSTDPHLVTVAWLVGVLLFFVVAYSQVIW